MEGNGGENGSVMMTTREEVALEEDEEMLKKRITGHPLYGLLLHTHLNCLKVGLGDIGEFDITIALDEADNHNKLNATNARSSDLDEFMEFYCMALSKLKEAMEKPLKETETFIDAMHLQLSELSVEKK